MDNSRLCHPNWSRDNGGILSRRVELSHSFRPSRRIPALQGSQAKRNANGDLRTKMVLKLDRHTKKAFIHDLDLSYDFDYILEVTTIPNPHLCRVLSNISKECCVESLLKSCENLYRICYYPCSKTTCLYFNTIWRYRYLCTYNGVQSKLPFYQFMM